MHYVFVVLALIGASQADVSHLLNREYLPPVNTLVRPSSVASTSYQTAVAIDAGATLPGSDSSQSVGLIPAYVQSVGEVLRSSSDSVVVSSSAANYDDEAGNYVAGLSPAVPAAISSSVQQDSIAPAYQLPEQSSNDIEEQYVAPQAPNYVAITGAAGIDTQYGSNGGYVY